MSEVSQDAIDEIVHWILSRPEAVQNAMRQFPPNCTVQTKPGHTYYCPAPGDTARVVSYVEGEDASITVTVTSDRDDSHRYECDLAKLDVVGYQQPFTPAFVACLLDPEDKQN